MNGDDTNEITSYIMQEPERIVTAAKVAGAFDHVLWEICLKFWEKLQLDLEKHGYEADESYSKILENIDWSYSGVYFRRSKWPKGCVLSIEAQSQKVRNFIRGCKWEQKSRTDVAAKVQSQLNGRVCSGRVSNWWPWYQSVRPEFRDWSNVGTLRKIVESLYKNDNNGYRKDLTSSILEVGAVMDDVLGI